MSKRAVLLRDRPHPSHIMGLFDPMQHETHSRITVTTPWGEELTAILVRVTDKVIFYREVVEPVTPTEPAV